jgi:effector-binding domain-containing protein
MTTFEVRTIDPQQAAVVCAEVPMAQLRSVFDHGFGEVMRVVQAQGRSVAGPPFGFYPRMPTDTVEVMVGFPVSAPVDAEGGVTPFELPGGRVVTATHVGPYERLGETYAQLTAWAQAEGHALAEGMWESYLSDPRAEPDPETWRTEITWPLSSADSAA